MPAPTNRMPCLALEAGIWALAALSTGALTWTAFDPSAHDLFGLHIDRLTTTLALLVSVVGGVTFRFARRYLLGEAGQVWFLRWQAAAIVTAMLLMLDTRNHAVCAEALPVAFLVL